MTAKGGNVCDGGGGDKQSGGEGNESPGEPSVEKGRLCKETAWGPGGRAESGNEA